MKKQAGPSSRGKTKYNNIINYWLVDHILCSLTEIEDVEMMNKFLQHSEHSVVGFFTDSTGKLAKSFKTMSDGLRESFRFAHTTAEAVLTEFGYSE